jgi:RimJ/RimL family protein N-acetyltransferase
MTVVETERLALREFTADDAAFILRIVNEPSFLRYIGDRGVRNLDDARKYIAEGPVAGYARDGHGLMRVDRKSDSVVLGMCGLLKRDELPGPDIGFSFLPEFWSQGYALESARGVLGHARGILGIGRILAITTRDNASSMRLLDKLGFHFERMIAFGNEELRLFASDP